MAKAKKPAGAAPKKKKLLISGAKVKDLKVGDNVKGGVKHPTKA